MMKKALKEKLSEVLVKVSNGLKDLVVTNTESQNTSKEENYKGNKSTIILPSEDSENDKLFQMVQLKMKQMENESLINRMSALEKVIQHLVFEAKKTNEENKLLKELVLHMSTEVEELSNILSNSTTLELDGSPYSNKNEDVEFVQRDDTDVDDEGVSSSNSVLNKKLRLN